MQVSTCNGWVLRFKQDHTFSQYFTWIDPGERGTCSISATWVHPRTKQQHSRHCHARIPEYLLLHYRSFLSRSLFITAVLNSSDPFFNERTPRNTRHWTRASPYLSESIYLEAGESLLLLERLLRPIARNDNRESNDRETSRNVSFHAGQWDRGLESFFRQPIL